MQVLQNWQKATIKPKNVEFLRCGKHEEIIKKLSVKEIPNHPERVTKIGKYIN